MQKTQVTFVIPNFNGADVIGDCLRSVFAQSIPCEVIVVDDGSGDDSIRTVEALFAGRAHCRLLWHPDNRGFAAAVNTGIRAASSPYVLLFNNDATAERDLAEQLLRAVRRRKNIFSVSALLLQADCPGRIDDCGDHFSAFGRAFSPGRDKPGERYGRRRLIHSACAGAALYDRELLLRLGAFDEAFGSYLEDVDVGLRAQRAGYLNVYEPAAVAYHKASHTSGSRYNAFKARQTTANTLLVIRKDVPAAAKVLYAPLFAAGLLARGVFYASKGLLFPFLGGLKDGIGKSGRYRHAGDPAAALFTLRRDLRLTAELLGNCVRHVL